MARILTVEQGYELVNAVYSQVTGKNAIAAVDTATFTAVASGIMKNSTNQIVKGLSEVLATIKVAVRPYNAKFRLNWRDESEFGAHEYKISYLDNADAEINPAWQIADGQTIGTHKVKLPKIYEANIWGRNTIMASITITRDQLATAFSSPGELSKFFSGLMMNIENQLEQQRESISRTNLFNMIGGIKSYDKSVDPDVGYMKNCTIHLLAEYNAKYTKTYKDIAALRAVAADYTQFIKFAYARVEQVAKMMSNRDKFYHVNPITDPKCAGTSGIINRHTPAEDLRCYICDPYLTEIETQVLTGVWNREYLQFVPHENVLYWQHPETPTEVKVTPSVFQKDGTVKTAPEQDIKELFAVLFDRDACGVGIIREDTGDTPYDVEKDAFNRYWKLDVKSYNDFTEKAAIFLMD